MQVLVRAAIVEDDAEYAKQLQTALREYEKNHQVRMELTCFSDGMEIAGDWYKPVYDVVFLDIEMQHLDGLKTAQIIRKSDQEVAVVFVTNMAQYAIHGYQVAAMDYLLKPVNPLLLERVMSKVVRQIVQRAKQHITLPTETGLRRIDVGTLLYVETEGHHLLVHTLDETIRFRESMKNMETMLQGYHFARCKNCYLVNLAQVTRVDKNSVWIGTEELSIARPRQQEFMDALTRYFSGR